VEGEEPLRTLKTYRWDPALKGVMFGQNMFVLDGSGERLSVGMELHASPASQRTFDTSLE
jgi:hypothetical protein